MTGPHAKIFWTGRSQAIRLPKEFRFAGNEVSIRRSGKSIILEPLDQWPDGYFESIKNGEGIERYPQGIVDEREPL